MTSPMRYLRRAALGISSAETGFARRGFRGGDAEVRERLEHVAQSFLHGYHAAVEEGRPEGLDLRLAEVEAESRGFAFEGAATGLTLLDNLSLRCGDRLVRFLRSEGAVHTYMVLVGVGWAIARLPWLRSDPSRGLTRLDPLLRWLVLDGFGFHEGYFSWPRTVGHRKIPRRLLGYARRAFDQGLGRSLWFVDGGDPLRISATIAAYHPGRRADLWSGVGLACAYAGGVKQDVIEELRDVSGLHLPHLALGTAFAAKARERAGNPAEHTGLACVVICGLSAGAAAIVTDEALAELPADGEVPAYEVWRARIRSRISREVAFQ